MQVTVRLFARHREIAGTGRVVLNVPADSQVRDVFSMLCSRYPEFADLERWTSFARNRRVVGDEEMLQDGDEVALLQPVSGGLR